MYTSYSQVPSGQPYGQQGPMHAEGFASYGAAPGFEPAFDQPMKSPFARGKRTSNVVAIVSCFLIPFFIFVAVMALQTFSIHYESAQLCTLICILLLVVVGLFGYFAFSAVRRRSEGVSEPAWYVFLFLTSLLAWIVSFTVGKSNYESNMKPYFDIQQLNVYASVDPAKYRSAQLMDAGRITFTPGSHLDLSRSMGFRNLDTYCVAPVVSGSGANVSSYEFWAVGINCCSGHAPDFHCGEYNNPRALSGLRLMSDSQRAFFRLAVDQAEAAYTLVARHPIFMYWMQDPIAEVNAYQDEGYKYFLMGVVVFAVAQVFLVAIAAVIFSRMYS
mmetsp:Transcript_112611/g.351056  ORF Transcript_112611/g.351056 Transcript_112611/m.351056 type:complete len:330 (+) Transcript_112611:82-1071(+)